MNIICDLDGTIALDHKRNHFLQKNAEGHRNWDVYFDACDTDEPCFAVINLLAVYYSISKVHIFSGRSMSASKKTLKWLDDYGVVYHYLQMRAVDDRTDDHELKVRWADEFGLTPKNTLFVLEDRQRVVDAWRAKGFRCFQVAAGNF